MWCVRGGHVIILRVSVVCEGWTCHYVEGECGV